MIADDLRGYAELNAMNVVPISGGEHEFSVTGCHQLPASGAVSVLQYDTIRVGGITAAQKINAIAEAHRVPVIPHAGQMHNYHLTTASANSPMSEQFLISDEEREAPTRLSVEGLAGRMPVFDTISHFAT